ncbi:hypothetical protein L5515_016528 [Caenorhabditis briggsae]|uniref:Uncharacterized protein n=1 Tax=Caenorhabditis briggsae TaxID=6238 RepID=A0AAE9JQ89_CAEBR|nr:hypothetical protein L5515_016528 [Caenorhabditis briggsae]
MQSMWIIVLLASTASLALCSATYEDYETPVDSYEMADYMSKVSFSNFVLKIYVKFSWKSRNKNFISSFNPKGLDYQNFSIVPV